MNYDPNETQQLVAELQKRAVSAPIMGAWYGACLGALACGFFAPLRLVMFSVIGGLVGGIVGFRMGQSQALSLRAKAQALLLQMKIEENTRGGAPR